MTSCFHTSLFIVIRSAGLLQHIHPTTSPKIPKSIAPRISFFKISISLNFLDTQSLSPYYNKELCPGYHDSLAPFCSPAIGLWISCIYSRALPMDLSNICLWNLHEIKYGISLHHRFTYRKGYRIFFPVFSSKWLTALGNTSLYECS